MYPISFSKADGDEVPDMEAPEEKTIDVFVYDAEDTEPSIPLDIDVEEREGKIEFNLKEGEFRIVVLQDGLPIYSEEISIELEDGDQTLEVELPDEEKKDVGTGDSQYTQEDEEDAGNLTEEINE